jgi:hypothetical protein
MAYNFDWSEAPKTSRSRGGAAGRAKSDPKLFVTITSSQVKLNSGTLDALGRSDFISFGLNKELSLLGIKKAVESKDGNQFDISSRNQKPNVIVSCASYIRYISATTGLDFTEPKKLAAQFDSASGTVVVDLKGEELPIVARRPRKA